MSPSRARALSSPLVMLLGPHHLMAVGARGCLVTGLHCSLRPWAVVAGTGCSVVGAQGRSHSWPVVGCCGHGRSWAVGGHCACLHAWAVGGRCGWSCRDGGCCGWSCCDHHGRGRSSPFVFMGSRLSLLEVIVVGSCRRLLSLCVGGGWEQSLSFIICVDGGGKEEESHITHRDNGITLEPPRQITGKWSHV